MTIRFVAFDLGNVLCDLDAPGFTRELGLACGVDQDAVAQAFDDALHKALERGEALPEAFRQGILTRLGTRLADEIFDRCWNLIPTPRPGVEALVARLKVPYAIWSNTDPIHVAHLSRLMPCLARATHLHFSFTARARKPEAAYYQRGLEALGARPQDVLFIDDREDNRVAAAAMGVVVAPALRLTDVEYALVQHDLLHPAQAQPSQAG